MRLVSPPSRHLLGQPEYGEDGLTALLDGSCLVVGCCGVMASVEVDDERVRWTDFLARGLPEIPTGIGFEFNRAQYEAALASIAEVEAEEWPAGSGSS